MTNRKRRTFTAEF